MVSTHPSSVRHVVTRIDSAHAAVPEPERKAFVASTASSATLESGDDVVAANVVAMAASSAAVEQMQTQAAQIGLHLRERRQELDHRESQLNARIAELERDLRNSRLWLRERELEFQERETALRQQIDELQHRSQAVAAAGVSAEQQVDQHNEELSRRVAELARRERLPEQGQARLAAEAERLRVDREGVTTERLTWSQQLETERASLQGWEAELRQRELQWQARDEEQQHRESARGSQSQQEQEQLRRLQQVCREQTDRAAAREAELVSQLQEAARERALLAEQRSAVDRLTAERREQLEREHAQHSQSLHVARAEWESRRKNLDQRQQSLETLQHELQEQHREALELRVVAEQLWQQAARELPAPELTQRLTRLRGQLLDEQRLAREELAQRRAELRELTERLEQRQDELRQQRGELQQWVERRLADVETQAAQLVTQEAELAREQSRLRDREDAWLTEKRQLQAELRRWMKAAQENSAAVSPI